MKKLQILGPGCSRCTNLAAATEQAAKTLGLEYQIEKVTDMKQIMTFGVMMTPALVVDGKVKAGWPRAVGGGNQEDAGLISRWRTATRLSWQLAITAPIWPSWAEVREAMWQQLSLRNAVRVSLWSRRSVSGAPA